MDAAPGATVIVADLCVTSTGTEVGAPVLAPFGSTCWPPRLIADAFSEPSPTGSVLRSTTWLAPWNADGRLTALHR